MRPAPCGTISALPPSNFVIPFFFCDILAKDLVFCRKQLESRIKISKMPYGNYLPEGKADMCLVRNAIGEKPPDPATPTGPTHGAHAQRGTISGASDKSLQTTNPSGAANKATCHWCLKVYLLLPPWAAASVPTTQTLLKEVTLSIFHALWGGFMGSFPGHRVCSDLPGKK